MVDNGKNKLQWKAYTTWFSKKISDEKKSRPPDWTEMSSFLFSSFDRQRGNGFISSVFQRNVTSKETWYVKKKEVKLQF